MKRTTLNSKFSVQPLAAAAALVALTAVPNAWAQAELQKMEVTGTAIRRIQAEGALPVKVINREAIEKTGATSVTELIQALPSMQGATSEGASVGGGGNGFSGASVHNLGETRTLVLLNGRRLAQFAGQYITGGLAGIDLNTIPLAAIERIEVLSDGASALYGADAIAGVVNFITKKDLVGARVSAGLSAPADGGRESRASLAFGMGDDAAGWNVMLGANIEKRDTLLAKHRDYAKTANPSFKHNGQDLIFVGGSIRGNPASIIDSNGWVTSPWYTANGSCYGDDVYADGTCYYNYVGPIDILPERQRAAAMLQGSLRAGDHTFFAEALVSSTFNTNHLAAQPGELFLDSSSPFWPTISATDPAADPAGVVVPYRVVDAGLRTQKDKTDAMHLVVGAEGTFGSWDYNTSLTHSVNRQASSLIDGYLTLSAMENLLTSGQINPFVPPGNQSPAVMQALEQGKIRGFFEGGQFDLDMIQGRVSRSLFAMGGGDAAMAAGVSWMREKFAKKASDVAQGNGANRFGDDVGILPYVASRNAAGAFAEMVMPFSKELEMTAAVRADHYSDFGNASTAKLSARYQPAKEWMLRASVGSGFKAPTVPQAKATRQLFGVTQGGQTCDPGSDLEQVAAIIGAANGLTVECPAGNVQYNVYASGNPDLKPETSRQWTVGFRIEPSDALSLGIDFWGVKLRNAIGVVDESTIFADPLSWQNSFTYYTDPLTGQNLLALYSPNRNMGEREESGVDLDVRARFATPMGRLTSQLIGSYWLKNRYQLEKDGEFYTSMGQFGADGSATFRWQARWTNTLDYGRWSHTLAVNMKSSYRDQGYVADDYFVYDPVNVAWVGYDGMVAQSATFDWQTQFKVSPQLTVTGGVLNLTDKAPPQSLKSAGGGFQVGYDDRYYDARGRTWYLNMDYKF